MKEKLPEGLDRRDALRLLGGGTLAAAAGGLSLLAGCGGSGGSAAVTAVPLAELPLDQRVRVELGEVPVEVMRTEEGIVARSLLCTHTGCEVRWDEADSVYRCPCHDGTFNAQGRPVAGPPPRPLTTYPVTVEGDEALIGRPQAG